MGRNRLVHSLASREETLLFGESLVQKLNPPSFLALYGPLGAGKTTLVQGLARGLGIQDEVLSPTFGLLHCYLSSPPLFHFDLYRLKNAQDFLDLGFDEYLDGHGICAIEWPEIIQDLLPSNTWHLHLSLKQTGTRTVDLSQKREL